MFLGQGGTGSICVSVLPESHKRCGKISLGEAPNVVDSYIGRQSALDSRKTPRFLRIISTPDDKQDKRLDGKDDLGFLRFDTMRNVSVRQSIQW